VADDPTLAVSGWLSLAPYFAHVASQLALAAVMLGLGAEPEDGEEFFSPAFALVVLGSYVVLATTTYAVAARTGRPRLALGLVRTRLWRSVGLTLLLFVACVVAALLLEPIFRGAESQGFEPDAFPGGTSAGIGLGLTILGICLVGPATEELYFRGVLYGAVRRYGPPIAIVLSALLFSVVHFQPRAIPILFVLGAALAFLYERTGSLWPPIAFHVLQNSLAMVGALAADAES
jgi:membrane protease YdiL (CAAX protease family)